MQTYTFQGMLVTDLSNSYAIFTYYCGDLSYSEHDAAIGYTIDRDLREIHEVSYRGEGPHTIACSNHPKSPWVNIVYNLTDNGKNML